MSILTPRIDRIDKNYIINGNFDFWQRGTSAVSVTTAYLPDRFAYLADVIASDLSRQADVPTSIASAQYSFRAARVSSATPTSTQVGYLTQRIEGNVLRMFKGKTMTLSFWVKSTQTGTYSINLRNSDYTRSYVASYTINSANTWEEKSITFQHLDVGTWNYTNGIGLMVQWILFAGSSYQTSTTGSWQNATSSNNWAVTGQQNLWANANANFNLAHVQLVEGEDAPSSFSLFASDYVNELYACQRYYEIGAHSAPSVGNASGVLGGLGAISFRVEKRAVPTFNVYGNGTINQVRNDNNGATEGTIVYGTGTYFSQPRSTSALSASVQYSMTWIADAEL